MDRYYKEQLRQEAFQVVERERKKLDDFQIYAKHYNIVAKINDKINKNDDLTDEESEIAVISATICEKICRDNMIKLMKENGYSKSGELQLWVKVRPFFD